MHEDSPTQTHLRRVRVFVETRHILDNIVLVQEGIHSSVSRKEQGMAIKLDMVNASDRVQHSFLFVVLERCGFSTIFIKWIKVCINFPWITPLVNGHPTNFF